MRYDAIIQFLKEVEKFKTCERTCQTSSVGRAESDAEHSWHLALFLMLIENDFQEADFTKLIKIALIHDLPEIYAGDTNPYRGNTENKEEKEKKAAKTLFASLPNDLKTEFMALFKEYVTQQSLEARIVKSADKLMPLIQNICTNDNHSSYRKLEVKYEEVEAYMNRFFPEDDALKKFYTRLLAESNNKGVFANIGAAAS